MNKSKNVLLFISVILLCLLGFMAYKISTKHDEKPHTDIANEVPVDSFTTNHKMFSDGLPKPDSVITYKLDEFDTGPAKKMVYYIDINQDGIPDRISKTFIETGNAHSYYEYKIELKNGNSYIDITPENFRTTNGAECDLQQIQFRIKPRFSVKLVFRELGNGWNQPTMAKEKIYTLSGDTFQASDIKSLKTICDVKELF